MGSKNSKQPRNDSASQADCEFSNKAQNDIVNQSINGAFNAVKNGDVSGLISTVKNIDINGKDEKQKTLAHHAAEGGFAEVMKVLADNGADFNLPDESGDSPIDIASNKGHRCNQRRIFNWILKDICTLCFSKNTRPLKKL